MSQEYFEIQFWRELFEKSGEQEFLNVRQNDFNNLIKFFPDLAKEKGKGLDYGCGLVSMLEFSGLNAEAYDPLLDEYDNIYKPNGKVKYIKEIKGKYDWILCCNVIDHTPDPIELVEDIKKHLKKGGRLYFEVNHDDVLSPAHYSLWRTENTREYLRDFKLITDTLHRNPDYPQSNYYAVYEYKSSNRNKKS